MQCIVAPSKYVVAVSGGVDSMVLLHVLAQQPGLQLIVAHMDHGIREDSTTDRELVASTAQRYGLPFVYAEAVLGPAASEESARKARYAFLHTVRCEHAATAIITAHHQDDVIETAILNMGRGTGWRGLISLADTTTVRRPLLGVSKQEMVAYATAHTLEWREDSTNSDTRYRRNYIRQHIVAHMSAQDRQQLLAIQGRVRHIQPELDSILAALLATHQSTEGLNRQWCIMLPHAVAREVLAAWLRQAGLRQFQRSTIERLVVAAKTARPGTQHDIYGRNSVKISRTHLVLQLASDDSSSKQMNRV